MDAFCSITEDHERVRSLPRGPEELTELDGIRLRQFLFMIVSEEVFEGSVVKVLVCSVSVYPQAVVRIQSYRHKLITDVATERAACKFNMLGKDSDYFKMSSVNFVGSLLDQMGLNSTI